MDNRIFCFYPASSGAGSDGSGLFYTTLDSGIWTGQMQVPLTRASGTPSAVPFDGKLWCFHQGDTGTGGLWYNLYDGENWLGDTQIPASALSAGPSACIYEDEIYCFYPGNYGDSTDGNALYYNIYDGKTWLGEVQIPETNIGQAPSATVYLDKLYCFHQGNMSNGELWYNVYDGEEWLGDVNIPASPLSSGPSACVYRGKLYCFYPGSFGDDSDGNALLYNVFDGETWEGERQVPVTNIANNPSAIVHEGMIYVFHEGNLANGELWYNRFDGTQWRGDEQIPASDLSWGPGATAPLRTIVRELLEKNNIYANTSLPNPKDITFSIPPVQWDKSATPDDTFNWTNRKDPPEGWGMTCVACIFACDTSLGKLAPGSIIIYPGIRMSQDKATSIGKTYGHEIQFNGKSGQLPLYQDRLGDTTSLHGQLISKLLPDSLTDFYVFKKNFLGFALDGMNFRFKNISHLLNSAYFYRVVNGRKVPAEQMSKDWTSQILNFCKASFPGVKG